jgi:hypothetical protein
MPRRQWLAGHRNSDEAYPVLVRQNPTAEKVKRSHESNRGNCTDRRSNPARYFQDLTHYLPPLMLLFTQISNPPPIQLW